MKGNALSARLTHSKTIGQDKALSYRLVVISERCYIRKQDWLSCGWRLLTTRADFQRDYLLPMPSGNLRSCVHRELRYDTAYALQRRVMEVLSTGQERVFGHGVGHYWTPHSGRNFFPSAAAALNIEKTDRDMLGGWAAQESDRYNRVAKVKIQMIQARVAATFADRITVDSLLETDALEDFSAYLRRQGMSEEIVAEYLRKGTDRWATQEDKETRGCGSLGRSSSLFPVLRRQLLHQRQTRRARAWEGAEAGDQVGVHLRARCGL